MADFANLVLGVDTSGLKRGERALNDTTRAGGRTEQAVKGTGRGFDKAGRSASTATPKVAAFGAATDRTRGMAVAATRALTGMVVGLGAVIAAGAGLSKFISATVEADASQAQLAATILSTGSAANKTIEQLNQHASALQGLTNFGDEATNAMQGLLLTFTQIQGGTFDRATVAVLDVATAMGTDLNAAALQVGKALNDPVLGMTALSRSGIQFTQAQKDVVKAMVATNDIAGAQNLILNELETQFGGSATAARDTLGGALTSLGNAFGDLFEISGEGSKALRDAIESLIVTISSPDFIAAIQGIGVALFGMAEALMKVLGFLSRLTTGIANTISVLSSGVGGLLGFSSATGQVALASEQAALAIAEEVKQADLLLGGLVEGREYSIDYIGVKLAQAQAHLAVADSARQENIEIAKGSAEYLRLQGIIDGARAARALFLQQSADGVANAEVFYGIANDTLQTTIASQEALLDGLQETTPEYKAIQAEIDYINRLLDDAVDGVFIFDGGLRNATVTASGLAAELAASAALMARMAALGPQQSSAGRGRGGDPRDFGGGFLGQGLQEADAYIDSLDDIAKAGKTASGAIDATAKALADQISALEDAADPLRVFNRGMAELDALKLEGLSDGAYAAAVEELREQLEQATPEVGKFTEMFKDGMGDAIDYTVNGFKDGFSGLLDIIKSTLLQAAQFAIANPIKLALGIGSGGAAGALAGGGGGSILGNIGLGGGIAGSFMSGGAGLVTSMMGGGGLASAGTYMSAVMGGATSSMAGFAAAAGAVALPLLAVAAVFMAFKKTTKELDAGVRISVTGMDALVEGYKKIETSRFFGLSKKVADEFEALDAAIADPMQNAVNGVLSNVFDMATGLGVAASTFDDFATSLIVSTKGMSDEQAQVAVADALRDIGVEFSELATDLFEFQRHGENAAMILDRLSTSVAASNVVMSALGLTLFDLTLGGANAASVFNDAFGSIEALNAISSNYYAKAFSDVERVGIATTAMSGAMSELGVVMPKTIAGFRNLIEQADRLGDMEKVADLLVLFGDFATMIDGQTAIANTNLTAANSNLTTATTDLNAAFSREMAATRDAFQVTIDGLNDDLTGARERLSTSKSIADALSSALDRRVFPSIEAQRQSQDAAAGYLKSLVGVSRIDDVDALQNALRIVADPSTDTFETLADYSRNFDTTSGVISALEKTAGFALSADEQAVNLLQTQIENTQLQSDTQIGLLRAQLDGILGLSNSLMSVGSSISQFAGAQASQQAAAAAVSSVSLGPIEQIYKDVLGRAADAAGLAFYRNNLTAGNSSLQQIRANIAKSSEASTFNSTGVARLPSFDGGGYTGNGSRTGGLDGQGGFLSMMHPQETVTDHTRGGNSKMEAQLDVLNARIEQLTAYSKQTTINTGDASFDLKDIRRNGVRVEPVDGAIFKTDEVA